MHTFTAGTVSKWCFQVPSDGPELVCLFPDEIELLLHLNLIIGEGKGSFSEPADSMIQTFLLIAAMEQLKNNHNKICVDDEEN